MDGVSTTAFPGYMLFRIGGSRLSLLKGKRPIKSGNSIIMQISKKGYKKMDELKRMLEKLDESKDRHIIRQIQAILYRYNEKHKGGAV